MRDLQEVVLAGCLRLLKNASVPEDFPKLLSAIQSFRHRHLANTHQIYLK